MDRLVLVGLTMELKLKLIKNLIRLGMTVSTLVFVMLTGRAQDFVEIASFFEDFNGDNEGLMSSS